MAPFGGGLGGECDEKKVVAEYGRVVGVVNDAGSVGGGVSVVGKVSGGVEVSGWTWKG